jgi:hypothetical protein
MQSGGVSRILFLSSSSFLLRLALAAFVSTIPGCPRDASATKYQAQFLFSDRPTVKENSQASLVQKDQYGSDVAERHSLPSSHGQPWFAVGGNRGVVTGHRLFRSVAATPHQPRYPSTLVPWHPGNLTKFRRPPMSNWGGALSILCIAPDVPSPSPISEWTLRMSKL